MSVLSPKVPLECPTPGVPDPECPGSSQAQSPPGVPNPRVSLPREGGDVRSKKQIDRWMDR